MSVDARMRFENYVVGAANKMAVAAARAVTQAPGLSYNPLVLYGASGVGKTHLLQAIGNAIQESQPTLRVEYLTLDDFVGQLHDAVAAAETDRFKQRWGRVDVLLLDDIQFLTERRETQSELLRLLEALQGTGRQIVMTSDRPPAEIADVDRRLITRLSGGLGVDIGAPDYETRVAILRAKCEERGVELGPGVVEEIGRVEAGNVRELQGLLNRIVAFQSLGDEPVRADDVLTLLDDVPDAHAAAGADAPAPATASLDFQSFLSDIASAVAEHVEGWKSRVHESVSGWKTAGYRTAALERLLDEPAPPANFEAVLRGFGATVRRLKELETEAVAADPALAGHEVFRDPERLRDAEAMVQRARAGAVELPGPSVEFSRAGLEVGKGNQLAVRAADAVAAEPGRRYNPLVIVGPKGTGKTHLLNAIGNELLNVSGGAATVACVTGQQFTDEFIAALRDGTVEQWRRRYRRVDALLMDDMEVVAGKERTQDEVFYLFNDLVSAGKQLVFTADHSPKELNGLDERLRSRFEGGLVVEVTPPDQAMRQQLYRRFLDGVAGEQLEALAAYLASRPAASVAELLDTVHRLTQSADAAGTTLSVDAAKREFDPPELAAAPIPTPATAAPAVRAASDVFFLDDEKVVWEWRDVASRLIEELG
ncbi:MAG: ATP-binding protein [Gemmatimonadota bacterium]|nr:ATP-binding protein [Gemmatimonadota bacterium]